MPPHSFGEWMIGQNLPKRIRKPAALPKPEVQQYKLELFTDDDHQVEKVALTYPRVVRPGNTAATDPNNLAKKVSFSNSPKPVIKKVVVADSTETASSPSKTPNTSNGSSSVSNSDKNREEQKRGRRRHRTKRQVSRSRSRSRSRSHSRSSRSTSRSHDTDDSDRCRCKKCKAKRKKSGLIHRERRLSRQLQDRRHRRNDSSDESDTSDDGSPVARPKSKSPRRNRKSRYVADSSGTASQTESSESESTYESYASTDTETARKKRRVRRSRRHRSRKQKVKTLEPSGEKKEAGKTTEPSATPPKSKEEPKEEPKKAVVPAAPFSKNTVPHPELVQPNLLLPMKAKVLKVEHAMEEPEDPRPNSYYDCESATVRVYHGPVYGNPSGTLYPIRSQRRVPSLPTGQPHPLANPYYEAAQPKQPWPAVPPMPYWPGQPPYPPAMTGYPPNSYYNYTGPDRMERPAPRHSKKVEESKDRVPPRRDSGKEQKSPPKIMDASGGRNHRRNHHQSPHPTHHQNRPWRSSRDRDGRGHDNDLNTNNDAANMFANDNNTGDGWGRSAWDNPLSPKPVEDDWTKQSTGDAWGSGPADNQGDNGNDFWGNKSYNDAWGSVDNRSNYSNHSNHGDNNANDNTNANDGGNVYNDSWGNWSNYGNPSQPITPDNSSDSCRKSSSGYTSYPQESNVMPSAVRRRGKMHNSGDEGKLNWVASPYPKKGHTTMPGAWDYGSSSICDTESPKKKRPTSSGRHKQKETSSYYENDFRPSWADPTAAQSRHDPPAVAGSGEQW